MPPQKVTVKPADVEKTAKGEKPPLNKRKSNIFSISGAKSSSKVADVETGNANGAVNGKVNGTANGKVNGKVKEKVSLIA